MCWKSYEPPLLMVATKNKKCFKIARQGDHEGEARSIITDYIYKTNVVNELGKPIRVEKQIASYYTQHIVGPGFHSYDSEVCEVTTNTKSDDLVAVENENNTLDYYYKEWVYLECIIPVGAIYCENADGELVSNELVVLEIKPLEEVLNSKMDGSEVKVTSQLNGQSN